MNDNTVFGPAMCWLMYSLFAMVISQAVVDMNYGGATGSRAFSFFRNVGR
jgi:hypothetical protein